MLLIRGGLAIGPDGVAPRDVLIDGETIAAVDERIDPPTGTDVLDAGGAYVIPGGIDPHTHLDLPVGAVRSADDFASGTRAAACGGTTCVVDFAGAGRESPEEALETWHEKAGGSATIDYGFHLTVTSVPEAPDQRARAVPVLRRGRRHEREAVPRLSGPADGRRRRRSAVRSAPRARRGSWCACTPRTARTPNGGRPRCSPKARRRPPATRGRGPPRSRPRRSGRRPTWPAPRTRPCTSCTCPAPRGSPRCEPRATAGSRCSPRPARSTCSSPTRRSAAHPTTRSTSCARPRCARMPTARPSGGRSPTAACRRSRPITARSRARIGAAARVAGASRTSRRSPGGCRGSRRGCRSCIKASATAG